MVSINKVYQTVLYILNKEQRGYLPPSEFNSLAELVQNEIFNSYFPDGNQLNRQNQNNIQNDTEFFNIYENNRYKLYPFEHEVNFNYDTTYNCWSFSPQLSTDYSGTIRLLGSILAKYNKPGSTTDSIVQLTSKGDYNKITRSKLTAPTQKHPLAYQYSLTASNTTKNVVLNISPLPDFVTINCIFEPTVPAWNSSPGSLGQLLYNPGTSNNFQLDTSEESNLIIGILKYAGVIINNPTIIDIAAQEAQQVQVNEKS
jgi:hypothetical protein